MIGRRVDRWFARYRRCGDVQALAAVFDATAPELLRLGRHLVGADAAEDLVQRTFLDAVERAERYDPSRGVVPWLCGVLANHARRHRRDARRAREAAERLARAVPRAEPDPAAAAVQAELQASVREAIRVIGEPYAEVLHLHLDEALGPRAIALRLGRRDATVRTQLARGIDRLRRRLAPTSVGAVVAGVPVSTGAMRAQVLAAATRRSATTLASPLTAAAATGWIGVLTMKKLLLGVALVAIAFVAVWASWGPTVAEPQMPTEHAAALTTDVEVGGTRRRPGEGPAEPEPLPARSKVEGGGAPSPLRVRVVDAAGERQPQRVVTVRMAGVQLGAAVTDAAGEARFADVQDSATLRAGTTRAHFDPTRIEPGADGARLLVLTLPAGLRVRGRVVDEGGRPLADAAVWVRRYPYATDDPVAHSGPDGRFHVGGLSVRAVLEVRKDGYRIAWTDVLGAAPDGGHDVLVRLRAGGARLEGIVVGPDGEPAPRARVHLSMHLMESKRQGDVGGLDFDAVLDADAHGRFAAGWLPPGEGHAIATPGVVDRPRELAWAAVAAFDVREAGAAHVSLRGQPTGRVAVTVFDAAGKPVSGARLSARSRRNPFASGPPSEVDARTDAEGRRELRGLVPGPYRVETSHAGQQIGETVVVAPGGTASIELRYPPANALAAELTDGVGRPHAGWPVELRARSFALATLRATTDKTGRATLEGLADGTAYELLAYRPDEPRLPAVRREGIDVGTRHVHLRFEAVDTEPGRLRGRFVAVSGAVRGVVRLVPVGGGSQLEDMVAADGSFELGPLPPGAYRLGLDAERHVVASRAVDVPPHATADLGPILVEAGTVPTVACPGLSLAGADSLRVGLRTAEGVFVLEPDRARPAEWTSRRPLTPGGYRLEVLGPTSVPLLRDVTLAPGEQRVEFTLPPPGTPVRVHVTMSAVDAPVGIASGRVEIRGGPADLAFDERFFGHFDDPKARLVVRRFGLAPGRYTIGVHGAEKSASAEVDVGDAPLDVGIRVGG